MTPREPGASSVVLLNTLQMLGVEHMFGRVGTDLALYPPRSARKVVIDRPGLDGFREFAASRLPARRSRTAPGATEQSCLPRRISALSGEP